MMLRKMLVIGLMLLGLIATAEARQSRIKQAQKNATPQQGSAQATPDERGTERAPLAVKLLNAGKNEKESAQETQEVQDAHNTNWWTVRLAFVAAAIGLLQLIVFGLQARRLKQTIDVMHNTAERQLRAYVGVEGATIVCGLNVVPPRPQMENIPMVALVIKNSGQTPAYKVASWAQLEVASAEEADKLATGDIADRFSASLGSGSVFTKSVTFLNSERELTPIELADIRESKRGIFVYGRIVYRDIFKQSRYFDFRMFYAGAYPPPANAILSFADRGNDSN